MMTLTRSIWCELSVAQCYVRIPLLLSMSPLYMLPMFHVLYAFKHFIAVSREQDAMLGALESCLRELQEFIVCGLPSRAVHRCPAS